jgi:hypothetical protein
MTIEFIDGRYFAALWYLEDEPRGNWMGAVYREPDGTWHLVYRHRYYVDDVTDPLEKSEDKKSWYGFVMNPVAKNQKSNEAMLVASVDAMLAVMKESGYGKGHEVQKITPRSDRAAVVAEMLTKQKFAHARVLKHVGQA